MQIVQAKPLNELGEPTALLVTYDLHGKTAPRSEMAKAIKELGLTHTELSESAYAIITLETPEDVYSKLEDLLGEKDRLYIITLSKPWQGWGDEKTDRWLNEKLPEILPE